MINPSIPFKDAPRAGYSWDYVTAMSEEQVRYALWATCVVLLGGEMGPRNNASIRDHIGNSDDACMNEAVTILASLALGRIAPKLVADAEKACQARSN